MTRQSIELTSITLRAINIYWNQSENAWMLQSKQLLLKRKEMQSAAPRARFVPLKQSGFLPPPRSESVSRVRGSLHRRCLFVLSLFPYLAWLLPQPRSQPKGSAVALLLPLRSRSRSPATHRGLPPAQLSNLPCGGDSERPRTAACAANGRWVRMLLLPVASLSQSKAQKVGFPRRARPFNPLSPSEARRGRLTKKGGKAIVWR